MRLKFGLVAILFIFFAACRPNKTTSTPTAMIPIDSANRMISSYLNSINYTVNDSDIRSLILDADAFRDFLGHPTIGSQVEQFKVSFAHTLDFINSGHENQNAGYQSGALTIVITGLDDNGNYVHYPGGLAIDNASHCPPSCPAGTGGNNLLMITQSEK